MRFSIATPVFNGMPWLAECVASIENQRVDVDVEHLVLDGGSTDGSRAWLAAHPDPRRRDVLEPDTGQTDALIRGFGLATGDVLGWLNADDLLEPGALAIVAARFEANPGAVIVSGAAHVIDPDGRVVDRIPTPPVGTLRGLLNHPTNLAQPATFFRASAYRAVGGLDRRYDLAMDVDLWMRLAGRGEVVLLPDVELARFRIHPTAKSVVGATAAIREDFASRRRAGLPIWSRAARYFIWHGYVKPALRPLRRRIRALGLGIL
jgi:glycosyltransferase involved in cell wall biosynthesis